MNGRLLDTTRHYFSDFSILGNSYETMPSLTENIQDFHQRFQSFSLSDTKPYTPEIYSGDSLLNDPMAKSEKISTQISYESTGSETANEAYYQRFMSVPATNYDVFFPPRVFDNLHETSLKLLRNYEENLPTEVLCDFANQANMDPNLFLIFCKNYEDEAHKARTSEAFFYERFYPPPLKVTKLSRSTHMVINHKGHSLFQPSNYKKFQQNLRSVKFENVVKLQKFWSFLTTIDIIDILADKMNLSYEFLGICYFDLSMSNSCLKNNRSCLIVFENETFVENLKSIDLTCLGPETIISPITQTRLFVHRSYLKND